MDLDSRAHGDGRERVVFMESSSFGPRTGLCVGLLGAVVASAFGLLLLPVALPVMTILPPSAALWCAKRQDVGLQELAGNGGAPSTMVVIVHGAAMVLTCAAMAWIALTGRPVLPGPPLEVIPGEGFLGGMAQGAVGGGMLGGLAATVGGVLSFRRANRHREGRRR